MINKTMKKLYDCQLYIGLNEKHDNYSTDTVSLQVNLSVALTQP